MHGHKGYVEIKTPDGRKSPRAEIRDFVLRVGPDEPERINLFCMYALRPKHGTYPIDDKNYRFGDYALAIFDVPEFFKRLTTKIKEKNIEVESGLVNYLDDRYSGKVGVFRKAKAFEYQSEWRLACFNGEGGVRTIKIGPINDISYLTKSCKLNDEIEICP